MAETIKTLVVAVAAGAVAACAALSRDIDDGGRARRLLEEAPTDAPLDRVLAQPSLRVVDRSFGDIEKSEPTPSESERSAKTCRADEWAGLVGRPLGDVDQRLLPEPYRVICYGCLVTQEYMYNRLNLRLDANGLIASIECG